MQSMWILWIDILPVSSRMADAFAYRNIQIASYQ